MTTDRQAARQGLPGTSHWAVLLAGPVVGTVYFFIVYLLAEVSCAEETALLSTKALRIVIVVAAVASAVTLAAYAWRGRQLWRSDNSGTGTEEAAAASKLAGDRRDNGRFMVTTGLLLLGMFLLFVLFLAAPTLGGSLC